MRVDVNLVLAGVALLAGGALQDLIPATGGVPVKWPFLTGVAAYYALAKPAAMALAVGAWGGLLTDVLGGLPPGCTCVFMMLVFGGGRLLRKAFAGALVFQGMALTGGAAALQQVWMRVWVRGTGVEVFSLEMLRLGGVALAVGFAVGGGVFLAVGGLDRFVGGGGSSKVREC